MDSQRTLKFATPATDARHNEDATFRARAERAQRQAEKRAVETALRTRKQVEPVELRLETADAPELTGSLF